MQTTKRSEQSLIGKINRKLKKDSEQLHKSRIGSRLNFEVGDYYVIDHYHNFIAQKDVDLNELAEELGIR
jgi:hypothetical protein